MADVLSTLAALAKLGQSQAQPPAEQYGPLSEEEIQRQLRPPSLDPMSIPIPMDAMRTLIGLRPSQAAYVPLRREETLEPPVSFKVQTPQPIELPVDPIARRALAVSRQEAQNKQRLEEEQRRNREQWLSLVATAESGNKEDASHATLRGATTAGQYAVGRYGLTPNTVAEMIGRMRRDIQKDPTLAEKYDREYGLSGLKEVVLFDPVKTKRVRGRTVARDPAYARFVARANQSMLKELTPDQRQGVARYMADLVLKRAGGDPDLAYFFWNSGHGRAAPPDWLLYNHPQVRRFIELRGEEPPEIELSKRQRAITELFNERRIYKGPGPKRVF